MRAGVTSGPLSLSLCPPVTKCSKEKQGGRARGSGRLRMRGSRGSIGRGRVRCQWGRVTSSLVPVFMRMSVRVHMARLVRAILCGLYRGARWPLPLLRFRSLGNHPIRLICVKRYTELTRARIKVARTVRARAAPRLTHPGRYS